ncbi:bcl-2 homologous antagonist/killer-like isoform X2 [Liolophura sinensis]
MAQWNGGGDSGSETRVPPGATDDEERVIRESTDVVKNFMAEAYQHDSLNSVSEYGSTTPPAPLLTNFTSSPLSTEARVGRQLAIIGDDINERYAHEFNNMISMLHLTPDTAYEAFAGVAKKLFADGINWGRIVTLLCFGYRIAMDVLQSKTREFAKFMKKIISYVVRFIVTERIAKWIAEQGGWAAALAADAIPSVGYPTLFTIMGLGILCAVFAIVRARKG